MYVLFLNAVFWMLVQLKALESSSSGMKKASCLVHCPINEQKWKERAMEYNCTSGMSYHCILTQAGVCELCFAKFTVRKSGCPTIAWDNDTEKYHPELRNNDCPVNITGCPDWGIEYSSDELYRFPLCTRSNQTDDDEIGNSESTSSHASATCTTEHVLNSTPSSNADTRNDYSGNHDTILKIVGAILGFAVFVALVFLYKKRKSIHDWVLHKRTQRRRRRQNVELMEYRRDTNPNEDESLLQTQIRKSDKNERQNRKNSVAITNEQQNETSQASKKMTLQTKDEDDELEPESDGHLPSVSSVTVPWVTFTENTCVVRCRVSRNDIKCTWHKKHTNGEKYQINDGDEIKVCKKKTFRMLFLPKKPESDGIYVCTLEDGNEVEIDIDVEDSGAIGATVGEEMKFVRKLDETGSPCSWYKNKTLLQNDERYIMTDTNEESTLTIKSVESGDPIPFGSKIGQEMQYYTLVSEGIESPEKDETDEKSQACEKDKDRFANPVDESDSAVPKDKRSPATMSLPPARKVHEQNELLDQIMGEIVMPFENWSSILAISVNIVDELKELAGVVCGNENLHSLRSHVQDFKSECRNAIVEICRHITSLIGAFELLPNPIDKHRRQKLDYSFRLKMLQKSVIDYIKDTKEAMNKLHGIKKSFRKKLYSVVTKYKELRLSPEELDSVTLAEAKIETSFDKICDTIRNKNERLKVLDRFFICRPPNKENDSTLISIIQTIRMGSARLVNERENFENSFDRITGDLEAAYQIYYSFNENNAQRHVRNVDIDSKGMLVSYKDK